ncbi:hypothetical protein GCM10027075_10090 [Streptomyces heilongjiangensis]
MLPPVSPASKVNMRHVFGAVHHRTGEGQREQVRKRSRKQEEEVDSSQTQAGTVHERLSGRLLEVIGNRMEPNRVSIRLFGDVARRSEDDAEVTEVQVQV